MYLGLTHWKDPKMFCMLYIGITSYTTEKWLHLKWKRTAENVNAAAILWKIDQFILKTDELPFLEPESKPLKPLILQKISQKSSVMPYCHFLAPCYCWNTVILHNSSLDLFFNQNTTFLNIIANSRRTWHDDTTPNTRDKAAQKERQIINYLVTVLTGHPCSSGASESVMHSSSQ